MRDNPTSDPTLINFTEKYGQYKIKIMMSLKEDIQNGKLNTVDILNLLSYTTANWILTMVTDDDFKMKNEELALDLSKQCYNLMRNYIHDFVDKNRYERDV